MFFSEIAPSFDSLHVLNEALSREDYLRLELPYGAGFLASQAFIKYRRMGGNKNAPLADFYIGAHVEVEGIKLITRDVSKYRTYFSKVKLIAPN